VGARRRNIPEWKIAVIQDAPSEFAQQFMYPGGGFALGNALGWVQIVDRMFVLKVERRASSLACSPVPS